MQHYLQYLLVSVVIRVNVVVKLLVFGVLFVTKLTVEIGSQVFQSLRDGFLLFHLVLFLVGISRVSNRMSSRSPEIQHNHCCYKKAEGPHLVFLPQFFGILFLHFEHSPLLCGVLCIVQLKGQTQELHHL